MHRSIRDLQQTSLKPSHKRRSFKRRPLVEGLEDRALLSAAHELAVHDHVDAKKPVSGYLQTDLVSDIAGVAQLTDSNLINPWGISFNSLAFGDGLHAGPTNSLLFTAGIDGESHGLFGTLTAVKK